MPLANLKGLRHLGMGMTVLLFLVLAGLVMLVIMTRKRGVVKPAPKSGSDPVVHERARIPEENLAVPAVPAVPAVATVPTVPTKFRAYDASTLGESELDQYLRANEPKNAFYFDGELSTGRPFAVLIGYSEEWLNVVTLNRADRPTYERYGFSLKEERWASGSAPVGAGEIRELVKHSRREILQRIVELAPLRQARDERRAAHIAREEIEYAAEAAELEAEQREMQRVQTARSAAIQSRFGELRFEFNQNKARHLAAMKEVNEHFRRMDLQTQTCDCREFEKEHAQFECWDIRRLCSHLSSVIERNSLCKRNPDPLAQFILDEAFHGVAGVHFSQLTSEKRFAVVARRDSVVVFVAAPQVRGDGFVRTTWAFRGEEWTSSSCSKTFQQAIANKLRDLLPE